MCRLGSFGGRPAGKTCQYDNDLSVVENGLVLRTTGEDVLEADVECSICMRGENLSMLASDIFGSAVFISYRIADLQKAKTQLAYEFFSCSLWPLLVTNINVDNHAIAFAPANSGCHNDKRILCDEIPYASVLLRVVVRVCL